MVDIAPSSVPIQQESVQFNQPVSESSAGSMGGAINYLLRAQLPIGSVIDSMLTEAQFQAQINNPSPSTWILADGRDVTGSAYQQITGQTTVPDFRGIFRRAKNNGRADGKQNPAGDVPLGTYQGDIVGPHIHNLNGGVPTYTGNPAGVYVGCDPVVPEAPTFEPIPSSPENVVKNITINTFIRIN